MNPTPPANSAKDERILRLLKRKRAKGLSLLYDTYAQVFYGLVYRVLKDHKASEEALQEVFLNIWNSIGAYDPWKGEFLPWMVHIARNMAVDQARLKRFSQKSEQLENQNWELQPPVVHPQTTGLKDLVNKLEEPKRQIVDLIYFEGYTQTETGKALDIPLGKVKTRLHAAVHQLGKLIG